MEKAALELNAVGLSVLATLSSLSTFVTAADSLCLRFRQTHTHTITPDTERIRSFNLHRRRERRGVTVHIVPGLIGFSEVKI